MFVSVFRCVGLVGGVFVPGGGCAGVFGFRRVLAGVVVAVLTAGCVVALAEGAGAAGSGEATPLSGPVGVGDGLFVDIDQQRGALQARLPVVQVPGIAS